MRIDKRLNLVVPIYGDPVPVRDAEGAPVMENGQPAGNLFASGEIMSGNILGKGYANDDEVRTACSLDVCRAD